MSTTLSRRQFMRAIGALGLTSVGACMVGAVTGCAGPGAAPTASPAAPPTAVPTPPHGPTADSARPQAPTSAASPTPAAPAADSALAAPSAPGKPAYLAVVRGADPAALVRAAVDALGGMARFCQPGYDVIIKPNICVAYHSFEYAATTNPEVVAALVALCLEAGAERVRVMDFPFGGTAEAAYAISGIGPAVEAAGGQMEVMTPLKFRDVDLAQGQDLKRCKIYQDALDADLLINVPIAKHHSMAGLTLGMKNLMGLIQDRPAMHRNFRQRLPDLASVLKPALTVIDAVRILLRNGPTGGSLDDVRQTNTIIASHDIVAADAYATRLFDQSPEQISYIVAGAEMGLGTADLASVQVRELDI
ncbi:MAG: DUF362 domain-containing protein [Anaerolineae bacterium]|jgi:uncharacterized protein (DUF362 family)